MNVIRQEGIPDCHIVNVVATYYLGLRLNLAKIAYCRRDVPVTYNPRRFAAMTINVEAPGIDPTTALVFASGNVVHTGAKTEDHSRLSAHYLATFFNTVLKIPVRVENFKITNMVSDMKTGFEVDLYSLKNALGSRATYKPERFPACRIRCETDMKQVSLIYWSGGVVLTGCKNRDNIRNMHKTTFKLCKKHRHIVRGSVSKGEYRMIQRKAATKRDKIKKINKKIKNLDQSNATQNATALGTQMDVDDKKNVAEDIMTNSVTAIDEELEKFIDKHVKQSIRKNPRGSIKNGVLYLKPISPLSSVLRDSSAFTPTLKV